MSPRPRNVSAGSFVSVLFVIIGVSTSVRAAEAPATPETATPAPVAAEAPAASGAAPVAAEAPAASGAAAPAPVLRKGGGFGMELSGGLSGGDLRGGLLVGIAVGDFIFGVALDALRSATGKETDAVGTVHSADASGIGIAVRVPLFRRSDERVVLFLAGEIGLAQRSADVVIATSSSPLHADGLFWTIGPGLRYWLTGHLAAAYVTRLRWMGLDGSAGVLGDAGAGFDPRAQISSSSYTFEGAFQLLAVF